MTARFPDSRYRAVIDRAYVQSAGNGQNKPLHRLDLQDFFFTSTCLSIHAMIRSASCRLFLSCMSM